MEVPKDANPIKAAAIAVANLVRLLGITVVEGVELEGKETGS